MLGARGLGLIADDEGGYIGGSGDCHVLERASDRCRADQDDAVEIDVRRTAILVLPGVNPVEERATTIAVIELQGLTRDIDVRQLDALHLTVAEHQRTQHLGRLLLTTDRGPVQVTSRQEVGASEPAVDEPGVTHVQEQRLAVLITQSVRHAELAVRDERSPHQRERETLSSRDLDRMQLGPRLEDGSAQIAVLHHHISKHTRPLEGDAGEDAAFEHDFLERTAAEECVAEVTVLEREVREIDLLQRAVSPDSKGNDAVVVMWGECP